MAKTIESQFKVLTDIYIKKIDYLDISRLFAKYDLYTINVLEVIYNTKSNEQYFKKAVESFVMFLESQRFEIEKTYVYFDKTAVFNFINIHESDKRNLLKTKYYYLLKIAFVIAFYQRFSKRVSEAENNIESLDDLKSLTYHYQYFRGQTNFEWRMSPSILRNLKLDIVFDDNYYFNLLSDCGLEKKYNDLIRPTKAFTFDNKYNKYSFLQHACSYSPFIDFTKEPIIATSFALSNAGNFNDFRNSDASIFCMRFNENKKDNLIKDKTIARDFIKHQLKLEIINSDYFVFGKPYEFVKSDGTKEYICVFSIDELLDRMTPDYRVFDIPTNDRMLYQKGIFICFYNCLCFKDFIAYELCPDLYLAKTRIRKRKKRNILETIYKSHREHDPEHLLDPYLFFKE